MGFPLLIACAAHTGLWRMPKTLLFVGLLYDFTKRFASLGFPSDYWNATQPSFLRFDSFSSGFLTILQKTSAATDALGK